MPIGSITTPDRICAPISDLNEAYRNPMPSFDRELLQADGGRKTRGATTDTHDVIFEAFPVPSYAHH